MPLHLRGPEQDHIQKLVFAETVHKHSDKDSELDFFFFKHTQFQLPSLFVPLADVLLTYYYNIYNNYITNVKIINNIQIIKHINCLYTLSIFPTPIFSDGKLNH